MKGIRYFKCPGSSWAHCLCRSCSFRKPAYKRWAKQRRNRWVRKDARRFIEQEGV
jgi:hypothetical protein